MVEALPVSEFLGADMVLLMDVRWSVDGDDVDTDDLLLTDSLVVILDLGLLRVSKYVSKYAALTM